MDAGALYLHEVVDIVGEGAAPYMAHTAGFHAETAADRGLTLLGTWQVVGATGRWPQVVNVWEMVDGWDGWERLVRATNLRRDDNIELMQWWNEAYEWRTGGFDRLLQAIEGSPSLAELTAGGVRGEIFLHEIVQIRVGAVRDYLGLVLKERVAVMAEYGHTLVGAYEAVFSDTEAVTIWATDLASHGRLMRERQTDERLPQWISTGRSLVTERTQELLVPHPGTPLAAR